MNITPEMIGLALILLAIGAAVWWVKKNPQKVAAAEATIKGDASQLTAAVQDIKQHVTDAVAQLKPASAAPVTGDHVVQAVQATGAAVAQAVQAVAQSITPQNPGGLSGYVPAQPTPPAPAPAPAPAPVEVTGGFKGDPTKEDVTGTFGGPGSVDGDPFTLEDREYEVQLQSNVTGAVTMEVAGQTFRQGAVKFKFAAGPTTAKYTASRSAGGVVSRLRPL